MAPNQDVQLLAQHADQVVGLGLSIELNSRPIGSITVIAPVPTTSTVLSGPMNAAVSSSRPRPMREGIVGQRRQQAAQPVTLAEMLVDDRRGW